ncbi:hypothetical protein SAMN04490243_1888 [Robiginitalea myxolifaciens]|uniref:Uncharacterized protein n=1 Tax=Robiginitalea myxolifaciens TaxID=400055 RepID=A0A1I6GY70_9FLAO|nr:hypothetical protein [Robiginitalea myxolifaciens]SFR47138.1 hypothetical protein SAMN04490243_1888 [Robiginitalea myxolifaciens]
MLLLCGPTLTAQEAEMYSGEFRVGKYSGQANFGYEIREGDTLLQGPFVFQRSNLGALLESGDYTFVFRGNFADDYPSGAWEFQFGEFSTDSQTEVVDFQYKVNVSGKQHEALGIMSEGKPDGLWTHTVNEVRNSKLEDVLFRSSIRFDKGIPQKTFQIAFNGNTLAGRLLRNGLAHDQWTLYSDEAAGGATEHWFFNEGVLERLEFQSGEAWQTIDFSDNPGGNYREAALDQNFFQSLEWQLPEGASLQVPDMLQENQNRYARINEVLSGLGKSDFKPGFRVSIPVRDIPVENLELWQSFDSIQRKLLTKTNEILENPQLQLARRSDEEAATYYTQVDTIRKTFALPFAKMARWVRSGALGQASLEELSVRLWSTVYTDDKGIIDYSDFSAEKYVELATMMLNGLEEIEDQIATRLVRQREAQELRELEKEMVRLMGVLQLQVDSIPPGSPEAVDLAIRALGSFGEEEITNYSSKIEDEDKTASAQKLVTCLKDLNRLAEAVAQQPERQAEIREAYTDQIWNPFTATIMDETVKRRLLNAYTDVLVNHILEAARGENPCEKAAYWAQVLDASYERMLELRKEDTSKLERKLKREKNPQTVIDMFALNLDVDE